MPIPGERYYNVSNKTPNDFKNIYSGAKILIIGNGFSTSEILPIKNNLKKYFNILIGLNWAIRDFGPLLDVSLTTEKNPASILNYINKNQTIYGNNVKIFSDYRAIEKIPNVLEKYKVIRNSFGLKQNIREYKIDGEGEGLIKGPLTPNGLSAGTVAAQAIHLAAILGAAEIYLIGCEMIFKENDRDHYYKDNKIYSNSKLKQDPVMETMVDGKKYKTKEYFYYSAKFIDDIVSVDCKKAGIMVYDFSGGILAKPIKLKSSEFFK